MNHLLKRASALLGRGPSLEARFRDKVAFITGGASGIGRALGERLVELGAEAVILTDVDTELLERTAWRLGGEEAGVHAMPLDVRSGRDWQTTVAEVYAEHGRVDDFFNNAGIGVAGLLRDTTVDDWQAMLDVNVMGVVRGIDALYPRMRAAGGGHIINTASVAGIVPVVLMPAYSATKHAVFATSMTLAAEARAYGVDVSVVCPGIVNTPILTSVECRGFSNEQALHAMPQEPIPVDVCAEAILEGVAWRDEIIVVGKEANAFWRAFRISPAAVSAGNRKLVARMMKMAGR